MTLPDDDQATHRSGRDEQPLSDEQIQLLAWAVVNCHMLARRALARTTLTFDREKWEHVLRICEKAGARSQGVLRASVPTEITDGAVHLNRGRPALAKPEPKPRRIQRKRTNGGNSADITLMTLHRELGALKRRVQELEQRLTNDERDIPFRIGSH